MSGYRWTKAQQEEADKRQVREDRPASEAQKALLKTLCEEAGRTYPVGLSMSEASDWISDLKRKKKQRKSRGTFEKNQ